MKRLLRSRKNNVITGVCGGLAEYLGVDVAVVRILTVIAAVFTGGTVLVAYVIASIVIPDELSNRNGGYSNQQTRDGWPNQGQTQNQSGDQWPNQGQSQSGNGQSQSGSQWENYSDINKGMDDWKQTSKPDSDKNKRIIGIGLVLLGAYFFLKEIVHWSDMKVIIPVALLLIGGAIIYKGRRNQG